MNISTRQKEVLNKLISIRLLSSILFMLLLYSAVAQDVINETYRVRVEFYQHGGRVQSGEAAAEPVIIVDASDDTDNVPTSILFTGFGTTFPANRCITRINVTDDEYAPVNNKLMGGWVGSTTGRFDYHVFSYEEDGPDNCTFNNGDDTYSSHIELIDVKSSQSQNWNILERVITPYNKHKIRYVWRYDQGDDYDDPLDFGVLTNGDGKSDTNSNVSRWPGTYSYTDQSSDLPRAQSSPDVWYKFTIEESMKRVTLSTDHAETTFDTYLTLFRDSIGNETPLFAKYNDDVDNLGGNFKSSLLADLCPGTYWVRVEGFSTSTGVFKLSVDVSPTVITPGVISISPSSLCLGEQLSTVISIEGPTIYIYNGFDQSNVSYIWQKKIGNGNWLVVNNEKNYSLSATGSMDDTKDISFRRSVQVCGITGDWSNIATVQYNEGSADGGTIALSGSTTIPEGFDPGVFSSVSAATTDPAPAQYQWKSSLNGTGYNDIDGATGSTYDPGNLSMTTWFKRVATNACGSQDDDSNVIKIVVIVANGAISGHVVAPALPGEDAVGIEDVQVCAIPLDTAIIDNLTTRCDTTDENGDYFIRDIYYGSSQAQFRMVAMYDEHDIRINNIPTSDSTQDVILSSSTPLIANFVDHTVFSISGNVFQNFTHNSATTPYGKNKVVIKVFSPSEPNTIIGTDTTSHDENMTNYGDYGIIVPNAGTYAVKAEFIDTESGTAHTFVPSQHTLVVTQNVTDVDFEDVTTSHLVGYVGASCNKPLGGTVELRVYQDPAEGNFDAKFDRQESFNLTLPARAYKVEVTESVYAGLSSDYESSRVKDQLDKFSYDTDITFDSDSSLFIYYHPPVTVELEGIPELTGCSEFQYSLLQQGEAYPNFNIKVWEGPISNNCPLDEGEVVIATDGFNKTIPVVNGTVDYLLIGGQPIIQAPHKARLTVLGKDAPRSNDSDTKFFDIFVEGEKPIGEKFVTVSPQIPFLILHDPPGDQSKSFMVEDTSYQTAMRTSIKRADETARWDYTQLGAAYSLGLSVGPVSESIDLLAAINDDETTSRTDNDGTIRESIVTMSTTTEYETSSEEDPSVIGANGDLYVGHALNYLYSETVTIAFDKDQCEVNIDEGLVFSPDSIKTTFALTGHAVLNDIRDLKNKANQVPDSAWYFLRQADIWEDMIKENELTKARAIANPARLRLGNITFPTGGPGITRSITSSKSATSTVEFLVELDTSINKGGKWEIAGNGTAQNRLTRVKVEKGKSRFSNSLKETTIGYTLRDNDSDDRFSVDIYEDPVYGTPIFISRGSETSCPHEVGSTPIDLYEVIYDDAYAPSATDIPSEQGVAFGLKIQNNGRFDRKFDIANDLRYSQGATVEIGGQAAGTVSRITVAAGTSESIEVIVKRSTAVGSNIYSFPSIRIVVEPECLGYRTSFATELRKTIDFSVDFRSTCSLIRLVDPKNGQVVNIDDEALLPVEMRDYDTTQIETVILEYAKAGTGDWLSSGSMVFPVALLPAGETGKRENWNITEVQEDGDYEIRLQVICPIGAIRYSEIRTITIDRTPPEVFGIPEPVDDIYSQEENDQISIDFIEEIVCYGSTSAVIVDLVTGDTLTASVSCQSHRILITPMDILSIRDPSVYRVILSGYEDAHKNKGGPNSWVFIVGDFNPETATCLPDLEITNNNDNQDAINVSVYRALSIQSNGVIPSYGTTSYKAQSDVQLDGGFEVSTGGIFEAQIENCDDE